MFSRPADDWQHSGNEQDVRGRVGEPARCELCVVHKACAEHSPDWNCGEYEDKRKRPVVRQEAAEQPVHQKREQQDEREIAEITLAEENVLDRTEISEARTTIVENAFTTMWLYRDRSSPFYSPIGVTENERPILAGRVADIFRDEGFRVQSDYLAGLAYRYIASGRARVLLPAYNFIDTAIFNLGFMSPFRPFVLTSGEKP